MRRPVLASAVILALAALVLPACGRTATGPLRYSVDVDAKSTAKDKFQVSAFFPGDIRVSGGDTIKFRNRSTEAPHTITFGVLADRSNQPAIITEKGENPVVTEPCQNADEPTAKLAKCDSEKLKAYDGTGYWNSGFIQPKPAPKAAGAKSVSLKLDDDIPAGDYTYVCILHPFQNGSMQIVDDASDRSIPSEVREGSKESVANALDDARELEEPELKRDDESVTVTAGWGDKITAVNRYAPDEVTVEPGTTVRWEAASPYEPHTVTFDAPFDDLSDPKALVPGGVENGSDYSGGFANSGMFAGEGTPFEGDFALTFTKAGTYEYACMLHPGHEGVVKVEED